MQAYESIFWGMALVVLIALCGGGLMGRLQRLQHSLLGVAIQSALISMAVAVLLDDSAAAEVALLMSIAAFMFSLVIGAAAALLTHRVRNRRAIKGR